jgi:ABC-type amino acid transport/signal transduction systems, periplasmic component/domain
MKQKRFALLLCLVLAVALCLTACSSDSTAPPASEAAEEPTTNENPNTDPGEEETTPLSDTILVMATEAGFRPYEYRLDDNMEQIVGIDIDIAQQIAAEMGRELQVVDMAFDSIIPSVNSGKAHFGAAGISVTEERLEQVDFSITYATSKQVILTLADSGIAGEEDLNGKNVGVQLGTVADLALTDDYPEVQVQRYNKYFEAVSDLVNGRIQAIVLDVMPAQELQKTAEGLVILEQELFTDEYAICVKKGDTEMLTAINTVLQRLMDEGKIDEFTMAHLAE